MRLERKIAAILPLRNLKMESMNVGEFYLSRMVNDSNRMISFDSVNLLTFNLIHYWKSFLGIKKWLISCESISEMQVVDALAHDTCGHEFVGISINFDKKIGIIHHTRPLKEDDIIHELLHVRYPKWSEKKVNLITNLLMKRTILDIVPNHNILVANG